MENNKNIEMTENNENISIYEFPESLKPTLKQCYDVYEIIKHELIGVDSEWLNGKGERSLIIDFKLDIIYLISFIAVMSGSADEFPLYMAEEIFANDPPSNNLLGLIRAAENMGIKELIDNYDITDEAIEKFDAFTSNVTNILKILPTFGNYYELSMIYYLYSTLIASICKLLEANAKSSIVFTGINNYLNTQFKVCEEHMSERELEQFENNVFPYLKRVNAKMNEVIENAKEFYGTADPITLKVAVKRKPAENEGKKE